MFLKKKKFGQCRCSASVDCNVNHSVCVIEQLIYCKMCENNNSYYLKIYDEKFT